MEIISEIAGYRCHWEKTCFQRQAYEKFTLLKSLKRAINEFEYEYHWIEY